MATHQISFEQFTKIYQLVNEKNKSSLQKYIDSIGKSIDAMYENLPLVSFFAAERNDSSVWFLLNEFGADIDDAVWGYAKEGHYHQVNQLIAKGASAYWALDGYMSGRHGLSDFLEKTHDLELKKLLWEEQNNHLKNESPASVSNYLKNQGNKESIFTTIFSLFPQQRERNWSERENKGINEKRLIVHKR